MISVYVAVVFLVTLGGVMPVSKDDPEYMGCFDNSYASYSRYRTSIKPCFTWDMCFSLCENMATKYVGLGASNKECFCGNDLPTHSTVLEDTLCYACDDTPERMCGGWLPAISVYRISDHNQAFMLATEDGIMKLTPSDDYSSSGQHLWDVSPIHPLKRNALSVAFDIDDLDIYYISGNKILRSSYIPVFMAYSPPSIFYEAEYNITAISVQWEYESVYFSYGKSIYKLNKYSEDDYSTLYINSGNTITDIASDPYDRYEPYGSYETNTAFFYTQPQVTVNRNPYGVNDVFGKYYLKRVVAMAIDTENKEIYVIGSYRYDYVWYIASTDYQGKVFTVHYEGPELSDPFALDVFDNQVVWGNRANNRYSVYVSRITQRGRMENITNIFQSSKKINNIKIYSLETQKPSLKGVCQRRLCSHECVHISRYHTTCKCPSSMILDDDHRTCLANTRSIISSYIDEGSGSSSTLSTDYTETVTSTSYSTYLTEESETSTTFSTGSVDVSGTSTTLSTDSVDVSQTSTTLSTDSVDVAETPTTLSTGSVEVSETSTSSSTDSVHVTETSTTLSTDSVDVSQTSTTWSTDSVDVSETSTTLSTGSIEVSETSTTLSTYSVDVSETSTTLSTDYVEVSEKSAIFSDFYDLDYEFMYD